MQKRHFQIIAETIRELPRESRENIAQHFSRELERAFPRFKPSLFLRACGIAA